MRVLLDTHTFLWFIEGKPLLSITARQIVEDIANERLLSIASVWEAAIKFGTGKLELSKPFADLIPDQLRINDIRLFGITIEHTAQLTTLPFHHRDPFDRLLIAQAMTENLPILSVDSVFDAYAVTRLW